MSLRDVINALTRRANANVTPTTAEPASTTMKPRSTSEQPALSINLYKMAHWVITHPDGRAPALFEDVDKACDYLMEIGVRDEQIDLALAHMVTKGTTRANFGMQGTFMFTDEAKFGL